MRGDLLDRNYEIDGAGRDGDRGHFSVFRGSPVLALRNGQAAALFDRLEAKRTVAAGAGEHDADSLLAHRCSQGIEESVDGAVNTVVVPRRFDAQAAVNHCHDAMGRRYVDVIRFDRRAVSGFHHRHRRPSAHDVAQHAGVIRRKMQYHDKRHAAVGRHMTEKSMERVDAAGGRTNADDGELGGSHGDLPRTLKAVGIPPPSLWLI